MSKLPVQPPVDENHEALAPYNFVPLPDTIVTLSVTELPDQGIYEAGRHTGYIDCELTTASPVYVRAALTPEAANAGAQSKDSPAFFYLNDKAQPVIPGSSLRGMMRTLVEIVTYSKVSHVYDKKLVYRSVGGATNHDKHYRDQMMRLDKEDTSKKNTKYYTPLIRAGYMVKKGARDWAIQPAKEIDGTTYAQIFMDEENEELVSTLRKVKNCRNAYDIYITTGKYDYQDVRGGFLKIKFAKVTARSPENQAGFRKAVLARSGNMKGKMWEAVIYERDETAKELPLTDDQIDAYTEQISKEQMALLGDHGALNDGQPVFYITDKAGAVIFFGHARMFRIPYPRSPFDHVPKEVREIDDENLIDITDAIFGYTKEKGEGRQRAYAGRVSFSDATLATEDKDIWLSNKGPITPRILSGPKPTTFQHYLVQIEPNLYPAGRNRDGETKFDTRLRDYASETPRETVIRGHKFYWHKGPVGAEDIREKGEVKGDDKQHTKISPLKSGVPFHFRISFENLNNQELGALLWVLDIAADDKYRLKIGMGKPLGMGAISIRSKLFIKDHARRFGSLLDGDKWHSGIDERQDIASRSKDTFVEAISQAIGIKMAGNDRIQSLLTMLQWPGPEQEHTRYMEIEHPDPAGRRGKRNEYRDRPVLPTPFGVWSKKATEQKGKPAPKLAHDQEKGFQTGVVDGFFDEKGFGFIKPDKPGKNIFVHINDLEGLRTLTKGQKVTFKVIEGRKGPQAKSVRPVS